MTFPILGGNSAVAGGYSIDNSLRFNDDDSAFLTRTNSAGNRKTWTWSSWVKRSDIPSSGSQQFIFTSNNASNYSSMFFDESNNRFNFYNYSGGYVDRLETNAVYRDPSAWYHFFIKHDSTQSTEADRLELYVNGLEVTDFATANYPTLNYDSFMNVSGYNNIIGRQQAGDSALFDGYIAETYLIDGTAKAHTDFGEFDVDSGIWKPKEYDGSYGTNGFHLDFEDSSSLGNDVSGNNNDFTATNLASTDQTTDTPTNNFATMSTIHPSASNFTISEGNLKVSKTGTGDFGLYGQTLMPPSGKWYFEVKIVSRGASDRTRVGIANYESVTGTGIIQNNYSGVEISTATLNRVLIVVDGSVTEVDGFFTALSDNDIVRFAVDMDNGRLYVGVNGNWWNWQTSQTGGDPTSGSGYVTNNTTIFNGSPMTAYSGHSAGLSTSNVQEFNFGNPPFSITSGNSDDNGYGNFEYAPPSGYLALCTQNLATELSPTIDDGSQYFNTILYTATNATLSVTGVGFQPDWVWAKTRTGGAGHTLYDSSRGATKQLSTTSQNAEDTRSQGLTSFDSDGYSMGNDGRINPPASEQMVAWNWKLNAGTTSSNTDGSITSTVQANQTSGFSVVTYTGNGSDNSTIGHGLGKAPAMIILKGRSSVENWMVYHKDLTAGSEIILNSSSAQADDTNNATWGDNHPSSVGSSTFAVGYAGDSNSNGTTYVAYCFAEIEGYSSINSYTGNGSTDGTFVYTGFKPAWVMIKRTDGGDHWNIPVFTSDANGTVNTLSPNLSNAERTMEQNPAIDYYSNGFKIRTSDANYNGNGGTYLYMAFGHTFVDSNGNPNTAR